MLAQLLVPVALPCIQAVLQGKTATSVTNSQTGSGLAAEPVLRYASCPRAKLLLFRTPVAQGVLLL